MVTATTVPAYFSRCCSSHATLSASRWLVGSSRSSRSGASSSSLHSATRRRSPPERTVTSASPGGQRRASMACSMRASSSQPSWFSMTSISSPCSASSASKSASGSAHRRADLLEAGQRVAQRLHGLLDVAAHVELLVERRLLQQDADRGVRRERGLAVGGLLHAGHDLEHGRLAGAVGADDADLGAGQERQGDVVEDHLVAVRLAGTDHGVDVLSHWASEPSVVSRAGVGPPDRGPTPCVLASDPPSPRATRRARAPRRGSAGFTPCNASSAST